MKELTLLSDELACLFSLLGVTSAMGVDKDRLFPDTDKMDRVYKAGHQALLEHKWMSKKEDSEKLSLSIDLIRRIHTIVNPRFVISIEIQGQSDHPPKRLLQYIGNNRIVEQAYLGSAGYRLTDVDDIPTALLRMNRAIGCPATNRLGDHEAKLDDAVFAKIKNVVDAGDAKKALPGLTKVGLTKPVSKAALLSMARPLRSGTVTFYQLTGNRINDLRAFAYFVGEGGGWVAMKSDPKDSTLTFRTANESQMWALISASLSDMMTVTATPNS